MRLGADSIQPRKTVVTFRQLSQRKVMHTRFSDWKRKMAGQKQARQDSGKLRVQRQIALLSARPDSTVLNDSIPLFFIGRNRNGFWVAREAAGRCGGLFVFRRSAARFARKKSSWRGCATMLVDRTIELDLPNQGNRFVGPIATTTDWVRRRAPLVATFIGMAIAEWRKLDSRIAQALNGHYRNREAIESDLYRNRVAIENDLFRGEYKLVSKYDDELPIRPRS
jgi:hypothetical protein